MLNACVQRFDVTGIFWKLNRAETELHNLFYSFAASEIQNSQSRDDQRSDCAGLPGLNSETCNASVQI